MKVTMLVATHKQYPMPENRSLYQPVYVGSELKPTCPNGYQPDNEGENISGKNPLYNELTAVYWAWKNCDSDIIGLNHYRRYFVSKTNHSKNKFENVLTETEITKSVVPGQIVVPTKRHYYIETIESHYLHSHSSEGIRALRVSMQNQPKEYQLAFEKVLRSRSAHMFNMFIMSRVDFEAYASWMFKLLFETESRIDFSKLDGNEKRVMGFISEFLLDTWIYANSVKVVENKVMFMEKTDWLKKGTIFLMNKITGGRSRLNTHL